MIGPQRMHDPFVQAVRTHAYAIVEWQSYAIDYGLVDRKRKALRIVRTPYGRMASV